MHTDEHGYEFKWIEGLVDVLFVLYVANFDFLLNHEDFSHSYFPIRVNPC